MRILVVGSGGREHAIVWKLNQSALASKLFAVPGNPGISQLTECIPLKPEGSAIHQILGMVEERKIDLVVIGPETFLEQGLADLLHEYEIPVIGPTRLAAQLETSKAYAKTFMKKYGIPTAEFETFDRAMALFAAEPYALEHLPCVIKVDGLASGKGVFVCKTAVEVKEALAKVFAPNSFGSAANQVVIEQFLEGKEASFFVLSDGRYFVPIGEAKDYKRLRTGNEGPNTGGMGAYAPWPNFPFPETINQIVLPTFNGLNQEGINYCGFLYFGLMMTEHGPMVLEYNARLGDPEAQVILPILETDFGQLLWNAATGHLVQSSPIPFSPKKAVGVVLASASYPEKREMFATVEGLEAVRHKNGLLVFHSGTEWSVEPRVPFTRGGRVLTVVGVEKDFEAARELVYGGVKLIRFAGVQYRTDIASEVIQKNLGG